MKSVAAGRWALVLFMLAWLLPAQAEPRTMQGMLAAGELRIGVSLYAPWAMRTGNGELAGSEVDMGRRLAEDMGLKAVFRPYDWDALIDALVGGEVDVIIAGMSVTPQRALKVAFSRPYASSGVSIATNTRLTGEFRSLGDLNQDDVAIAVIEGTLSADLARRVFDRAAIKSFRDEERVERALLEGLVHAYVRSEPVPRFLALRHPEVIDVPLGQPLMSSREAFAVRKGDPDWVNFLDAWIVAREDDAWIASTRRYWFDSLDWREEVAQ